MKTFTPKDRSEVDIRVAQEIKNHKDLLYEAHQKINALNEGVISLSLAHEKSRNEFSRQAQSVLISFENLRESVDDVLKQVGKRLGDAESKLFEILDEFNELKEEVAISHIDKEQFESLFDELENRIVSNHLKQAQKNDSLNNYVQNLQQKATEDLRTLREELAPKEPEIKKEDLEKKFDVWKVDFDGLVKEIAILKKAVAYDQKKFENVYTLIERLKAGKE